MIVAKIAALIASIPFGFRWCEIPDTGSRAWTAIYIDKR